MSSFIGNVISGASKIIGDTAGVLVDPITDIFNPNIEIPEVEAEDVVDPQEAVTEAAEKKRALLKKQQQQSTLLTETNKTGGNTSLLG